MKRTGAWDSWLSAKGVLEFNPTSQNVSAYGNARLKVFRFGLTSTQVIVSACLSVSVCLYVCVCVCNCVCTQLALCLPTSTLAHKKAPADFCFLKQTHTIKHTHTQDARVSLGCDWQLSPSGGTAGGEEGGGGGGLALSKVRRDTYLAATWHPVMVYACACAHTGGRRRQPGA